MSPESLHPGDFLSLPQVSRICETDFKTVEGWIQSGLKAEKSPVTGHFRLKAEDLASFLTKNNKPIPAALSGFGKKRVMIVDDEDKMISAMRRVLADLGAEIVVSTAENGMEASQLIEKIKPHLVVLDVWMPKMDGFKLCAFIKKNPATSSIKVLAISGLVKKEEERLQTDFKADAFLEKPFSNDEFLATVKSLL